MEIVRLGISHSPEDARFSRAWRPRESLDPRRVPSPRRDVDADLVRVFELFRDYKIARSRSGDDVRRDPQMSRDGRALMARPTDAAAGHFDVALRRCWSMRILRDRRGDHNMDHDPLVGSITRTSRWEVSDRAFFSRSGAITLSDDCRQRA